MYVCTWQAQASYSLAFCITQEPRLSPPELVSIELYILLAAAAAIRSRAIAK